MHARRLTTNVLLACASVALAAAVIELGVRMAGLEIGRFLRPTHANCLRRSPLLSYQFRPLCSGELSGTTFTTNSFGARGADLQPDRTRRVLALGDSCTWGWAVGQDESYPMQLQHVLDAENGGVDVINAGVPGYTSYQGVRYLRAQGVALHPSVIIIAFGFNDQFESGNIARQIAMEQRYQRVLQIDDFLLDRSTAYRWARWRVAVAFDGSQDARVSPSEYRDNLTEMVRMGRDAQAAVMLLSFWSALGKRADYRQVVHDVAAELDVPIVEYGGKRIDMVHPTREGCRTLAADIRGHLRTHGLP